MLGFYSKAEHKGAGSLALSTEALETANRRIAWSILGTGFALWLFAGISDMRLLNERYFALALGMALVALLLYRNPPQRPLLSRVWWHMLFGLGITLIVLLYPRSSIQLFYSVLPFVAVVGINIYAGVLSHLGIIATLAVLSSLGAVPPLLAAENLTVIAGGAFLGLIGWVCVDSLLASVQWATIYYEMANTSLEELRQNRMELVQTQADLVSTNDHLARLNRRLEALQQLAESARQAKADFVANVSHELRAPLNVILGFIELMTNAPRNYGAQLPSYLLADINVIQKNATHLSRLIDDVLDLGKIEAGRMAIHRDWSSVSDVISAALAAIRPIFDSKGLFLTAHIQADLPTVFCDGMRIRQVLINLLSNAWRFTEHGGVTLNAVYLQEQAAVVFSVKDTGPGISKAQQSRLFEPFQQADNAIHREIGGTGLGLNISRHFVEMHGGKIWLESEPRQGTTIIFSLPVNYQSDVNDAVRREDTRWKGNPYLSFVPRAWTPKAPKPSQLPHVIIVDQGTALARLFQRETEVVSVTHWHTLDEAIAMLQRTPTQALIVNVGTSNPDSLDTNSFLRAMPETLPTILCWLPSQEGYVQQLGVADYLVKPILQETLLSAVRALHRPVRTILLVDDDPDLLHLFARTLGTAPESYRVWRAESGAEALLLMRERQPDLIVLDKGLPDMSGEVVFAQIRADPMLANIPVIIISACEPPQAPSASQTVIVSRRSGFSESDLLRIIRAVSAALSPEGESADQASPTIHGH